MYSTPSCHSCSNRGPQLVISLHSKAAKRLTLASDLRWGIMNLLSPLASCGGPLDGERRTPGPAIGGMDKELSPSCSENLAHFSMMVLLSMSFLAPSRTK